LSQELITYIVLGSSERLKNLKKPDLDNSEEYIFANFTDKDQIVLTIDDLVAKAKGRIVVLLPPSCMPDKRSKNALKKISMIDISTWGWFEIKNKEKDILKSLKKFSVSIRSIQSGLSKWQELKASYLLARKRLLLVVSLMSISVMLR